MASQNELLGKDRTKTNWPDPPENRPNDPRVIKGGVMMYHSEHEPQMVFKTDNKAKMEMAGWREDPADCPPPAPKPAAEAPKPAEEKVKK